MKKTIQHSPEVKAYTLDRAMVINAQRAFSAQPIPIVSIGSTGLNYTRSMGGSEGSRL